MNPIKIKRQEAKLTQKDLALKLGLDKSSISKWETGESNPRFEQLPKLAIALNCSIDELLPCDS